MIVDEIWDNLLFSIYIDVFQSLPCPLPYHSLSFRNVQCAAADLDAVTQIQLTHISTPINKSNRLIIECDRRSEREINKTSHFATRYEIIARFRLHFGHNVRSLISSHFTSIVPYSFRFSLTVFCDCPLFVDNFKLNHKLSFTFHV